MKRSEKLRGNSSIEWNRAENGKDERSLNCEMKGTWQIREMMPEDLEEVFAIENSDPLAPWSKRMFLEEMQHPLASCFVILRRHGSNQPVVGFICFRNIAAESELLKICVHSDYRQLGVGKKLMQFYVEFSHRRGIKRFHLEVHSSNHAAIHLYQSFSYEASGLRKRFYQGKFDALLMTKKI